MNYTYNLLKNKKLVRLKNFFFPMKNDDFRLHHSSWLYSGARLIGCSIGSATQNGQSFHARAFENKTHPQDSNLGGAVAFSFAYGSWPALSWTDNGIPFFICLYPMPPRYDAEFVRGHFFACEEE